ncbi:hypothetical protein C7477_1384 [Phyllobacterium leguminum]|uniref:Uncharacterized protein n=1 Tax=Phyllobacterium leguminum TaxID=314237 RepID=A0A318SU36_9HYPH|nr:hypothetical protein C7477_1384 [Phyllobacterium leguminum]
MAFVNMLATLWITFGIEAEENSNSFPPIRTFTRGIEEPKIKNHVLTIIDSERLACRRFVQKCGGRLSHLPYSVSIWWFADLLLLKRVWNSRNLRNMVRECSIPPREDYII